MPLVYGGGISSLNQAKKVFDIGFEKVAINTQSAENPSLIGDIARHFGSQAVIASIDVKRNVFGNQAVRTLVVEKILDEILLLGLKKLKKWVLEKFY